MFSSVRGADLLPVYDACNVLDFREAIAEMATVKKIICFDIDGTLVKSDPTSNMVRHSPRLRVQQHLMASRAQVHKDAFSHAMKNVFGVDARIEEIKHQGVSRVSCGHRSAHSPFAQLRSDDRHVDSRGCP